MNCDDARLLLLLTGDDESEEFHSAAEHLDECPRCRERLFELSSVDFPNNDAWENLRDIGDPVPLETHHDLAGIFLVGSTDQGDHSERIPLSLDFLQPPSHPELLGKIGRYDVEQVIGTGGMGIVLKGFDTNLHRVVAIKVLAPHLAHSAAARRRFAREAQAAAAIVHEHVIPIYNVEADSDLPYLVMQYVPGKSLQARVDEQGPLPCQDVLRIAVQVAAGLAAAHAQGVIHRDVKPANILLEESVDRVVISDFGLARTVDDATLTHTGIIAGTPHYMSPEQASGARVDHRSDLFSLGSLIYFMCTGRPPYRADNAMAILNRICHEPHRPLDEINPEVPPELAEIVDGLLAKDSNRRISDAATLSRRLETLLADVQQGRHFSRNRFRRNFARLIPRLKTPALLLTASLACMFVGVGLTMFFTSKRKPEISSSPILIGRVRSGDQPTENQILVKPLPNSAATSEFPAGHLTTAAVKPLTTPVVIQDTHAQDLAEIRRLLSNLEAPRASSFADNPGQLGRQSWLQQLTETQQAIDRIDRRSPPSSLHNGIHP
ncbi:MAG: serine/threonine-protein kinase [Planctomycetales bacterium]